MRIMSLRCGIHVLVHTVYRFIVGIRCGADVFVVQPPLSQPSHPPNLLHHSIRQFSRSIQSNQLCKPFNQFAQPLRSVPVCMGITHSFRTRSKSALLCPFSLVLEFAGYFAIQCYARCSQPTCISHVEAWTCCIRTYLPRLTKPSCH
jgi:hypothetical protein